MRLIRLMQNFCIPFTIILLSIIYLFNPTETVYACAVGDEATIKIVARDKDGDFISDIKYTLYEQIQNADSGRLLGRAVKSGVIGETGIGSFSMHPDAYDDPVSGRSSSFVLKLYETNPNAGEFFIWDKSYVCGGGPYNENFKLSSIKVILRNLDGISLKNKKFELYEQKSDREGNPLLGDVVGKAFTTGDFGETRIFVAPGEYIIRVASDVGTNYQKNDIVVESQREIEVDYTLSNVSIVIRDGGGNLLPNNSFTVYKQITNTDGVKVLGTKMGSYTTGLTGQKSIYLPTDTYVITFAGTGKNLIYLWDQTIQENESYDLNYRLPTLSVTARGFDNKLLSNVAVKVYNQSVDVDGQILLGDVVASGNTGVNGSVKFFVPSGRYVVELVGPDKQKNLYYYNDLAERGILNLEKTLSALKIVLKDADGNLLLDVPVSLVEQLKDAQGNFVVGKVLNTKNTKAFGIAEFYFPPGRYALRINGTTKEFYYFWDKEIVQEQASIVNLTLSVIRIVARDSEGKLVKNVAASLYNQDYDLANVEILGTRLATVNTGEEGYADIRVPEGIYIIKAGESTNYNLAVKENFLTTVNLSKKGDIVSIESISDPRPAVLRPNNSLLRSALTGKIYVLLNGQLRYISSTEIFGRYGYKWEDVQNVSQEELDSYEVGDDLGVSAGAIIEGSVVKASDNPTVYLIEGGKKRPFATGQTFLGMGYKWGDIVVVSIVSLANIDEGEIVEFTASAEDVREGVVVKASNSPAVYLIEDGKKRAFATGQAFESRGYEWSEILVLKPEILEEYEEGEVLVYVSVDDIVGEGSLIKSDVSPIVYLISNNRRRIIASERIFLALGFEWESVLTVSQKKVDEYTQDLAIDFTEQDFDRDGLSNLQEEFYGTDPNDDDSDNDGFIDGREVNNGFNPLGSGNL
ncbi:MAG: hypothetical protein A3F93_02200 [Candidatus Magasanikbacteria bacterium RIFCSPLOWO2_12_FULL_34_7]|nr:MAG: hypothetical protein A3F93_02200 [Candidatus Magasanikbacteria bacterium RIFCSPLOWO2_12_FULL_34_7]